MIINVLALLLTIIGLIALYKDKEQHQWYMYVLGAVIGFFAWKAALHSLWFIITLPIKLITFLGGLL
jgi:hypothetical protein